MATRERPGDRGRRRASEARTRVVVELARTRRSAGLSLRDVGRATGLDHAWLWRLERGIAPGLPLEDLGAIAEVLGQDLALRLYPAGDPLRDAGHARLLARFRRELHPSLRWRTEVPLPIEGDRRAWDGVIEGPDWRLVVEAETVLDDLQALERRLTLKIRDGQAGHAILLVSDTARNRRALAAAAPAALSRLPGRSREILAELRAGRDPGQSGIVIR